MKIAVTDANIFIDLIKLQLLELFFQLELEIHTTIEVIEELYGSQQAELSAYHNNGVLTIHSFEFEDFQSIIQLTIERTISIPDATVIYYALRVNAIVLSGDNKLRKSCIEKEIEVHGMVWIFDQLVERLLLPSFDAAIKMQILISFNDRLPMEDCAERIKRWSAK
ncbi:MAG: hypothetical protein SFU99_03795 [Saprospiraceae bacterium]|nr:hypothetical protein [Saprospiraceae bacterium]